MFINCDRALPSRVSDTVIEYKWLPRVKRWRNEMQMNRPKKKRVSNSISPQFVECIDMITIKRIRLHIFWYEFHMHKLWWQIITIKSSTAFIIRREIKLIIISLLVVWFFFCHKLNFITNNVHQLSASVRWLVRLPSSVRARRKGKSWTHCVYHVPTIPRYLDRIYEFVSMNVER